MVQEFLLAWVIVSIVLIPLPFIFQQKQENHNYLYKIGFFLLVVGKIIEGSLNFSIPYLWTLMYISDPLMLLGSIMLYVSRKDKNKKISQKRYSIAFCGILLIAIFIYLSVSFIHKIENLSYIVISIIYFSCFWIIALSYLEIGSYHALAFVGAVFVILNTLICFIYDSALYAGKITLEQYSQAPWYMSYMCQSVGGLCICLVIYLTNRTSLKTH